MISHAENFINLITFALFFLVCLNLHMSVESLEIPLPKSFLNPTIDIVESSLDGSVKREIKHLNNIQKPSFILSTPQHSLFISSFLSNEVLYVPDSRIQNAVAYTFAKGHGLDGPWGIAIENNQVYISSFTSDQIHIYNLDTWRFEKSFGNEEELNCPEGIAIGGSLQALFVASFLSDSVVKYGLDGNYEGTVIRDHHLLKGPEDVAFLDNDQLLVSSHYSDVILLFNSSSGRFLKVFTEIERPVGITVGLDRHVYATSYEANAVLRYNGTTGRMMDVFAAGQSLYGPSSVSFADQRSMYCTSYNNDKVILFNTTSSIMFNLPLKQSFQDRHIEL